MSLQEAERRIAECRETQNPELDLRGLDLLEVPQSVWSLSHLQSLNLSGWGSKHNRLQVLPEDLAQLTNLTKLSLTSNRLATLPHSITQLTNLTHLDLSGNEFSLFPEFLSQLVNLTYLSLNLNDFKAVPSSVSNLSKLQALYLSYNQLSVFPDTILHLPALLRLELSANQLGSIPNSFAQLINLQRLDLSRNKLLALPDTFVQLTNLRQLLLFGNQLSLLPVDIFQLTNLQELSLSTNQLRVLPQTITDLPNLQKLDLGANPLQDPPLEIAIQGIDAIRTYFAERATTPEDIGLYESKLLLVGEGRVGKTSLSKSLRIPDYQLEDEQTTEGIDIQSWTIPAAETGLAEDFRLNVWDFGGQEIYHATHQFFLTRRSLYLLVTESRREDKHEDFYYWFNIIRLLGDNAPVVVVLNKCDQPTKELPIEEYRKAFGNIIHYEKISCAPGHESTIDTLKAAIRRILTDKQLMPHVGERLPGVWLRLRADLAELRDQGIDYIANQQFLDLCAKHKMVEPERIKLVDGFFHDLGIFLHFRDDLNLCDTIFLNHEWVTDGVYNVLDNPTVKAQQGRFTDSDLIAIWSAERYRDKRRELLALMKNTKFELCYELPPVNGQRQGYLAPQLLPIDEIAYEWRTHEGNLRFEYRYDFMPKGILSRFIVKRHQDVVQATDGNGHPQQVHWRYGVLLEWEGTRALVRERYFEKKITIAVEGPNKIGFLAIIRHSIQAIHDDFHNLQVHEMVPCACAECRNAHQPHFFRYELLERYLRRGRYQITCDRSVEDVNIRTLLRETFPPEMDRNHNDRVYHIHGDYIHGDKVGADKIGGHKAGGDLIDVGDIQDASDIAIGKAIDRRNQ